MVVSVLPIQRNVGARVGKVASASAARNQINGLPALSALCPLCSNSCQIVAVPRIDAKGHFQTHALHKKRPPRGGLSNFVMMF